MRPFLVYKMSKSNLCIHHRYLESGPPLFHLVCWTHSAMFQSVSSPALQCTRVTYAKSSSCSYFPNCDNHNFIPFETTITISQKNNLPSSCTTYIKSVSTLYLFTSSATFLFWLLFFSPSFIRTCWSLCNTHLVPAAAPISYMRHAGREQHLKTRLFLLRSSRAKHWIAFIMRSRQGLYKICKRLWPCWNCKWHLFP